MNIQVAAGPEESASQVSLVVSLDKPKAYRYDWVDVTAEWPNELSPPAGLTLEVEMTYYDQPVYGLGDKKRMTLRPQTGGKKWFGRWPVPFGPPLGQYQAVVTAIAKGDLMARGTTTFEVMGRESFKLPKGFSVLTVEGRPDSYGHYRSPFDPKNKGVDNLVEWAKWMGVDALWCLVGDTHSNKKNKYQGPWASINIKQMERVSAKAKEEGVKYGGWMATYYIWGDHQAPTGYQFATKYDFKKGLKGSKFVSMGDPVRHRHLVELAQKLEANANVSYIGFDYFRTDEHGGYEWVDDFAESMKPRLPEGWFQWGKTDRMVWLATRSRIDSKEYNRLIGDQWEWYRARRMAMELKSILEDAKVTKPVWIFTLGWQEGHEHGQDPMMLVDAGAGINSLMLYHCRRPQYESMMKTWAEYLQNTKGSFVLGDMVDWTAHDQSLDPPGPLEAWDRHQMAAKIFLGEKQRIGLFWHDLARILGGNIWPYTGVEWAVAGATSFFNLREASGRSPVRLSLTGPKTIGWKSSASVTLMVTNVTEKPMENVKVQWLEPDSPSVLGGVVQVVGTIPPGGSRSQTFSVEHTTPRPAAAQAVMAACVVTWAPGHHSDRAFAYHYLKGEATKTTKPTGPTKTK